MHFMTTTFLEYLKTNFTDCIMHHWHYDLITNIADYAQEHFSGNEFIKFMTDMIPEITKEEISKFYVKNK